MNDIKETNSVIDKYLNRLGIYIFNKDMMITKVDRIAKNHCIIEFSSYDNIIRMSIEENNDKSLTFNIAFYEFEDNTSKLENPIMEIKFYRTPTESLILFEELIDQSFILVDKLLNRCKCGSDIEIKRSVLKKANDYLLDLKKESQDSLCWEEQIADIESLQDYDYNIIKEYVSETIDKLTHLLDSSDSVNTRGYVVALINTYTDNLLEQENEKLYQQ